MFKYHLRLCIVSESDRYYKSSRATELHWDSFKPHFYTTINHDVWWTSYKLAGLGEYFVLVFFTVNYCWNYQQPWSSLNSLLVISTIVNKDLAEKDMLSSVRWMVNFDELSPQFLRIKEVLVHVSSWDYYVELNRTNYEVDRIWKAVCVWCNALYSHLPWTALRSVNTAMNIIVSSKSGIL
jgi:hypothetical protein